MATANSISAEFLALMRKVAKSPLVMDVLNIPGVQKSLERLADLLGKIYVQEVRKGYIRGFYTFVVPLVPIVHFLTSSYSTPYLKVKKKHDGYNKGVEPPNVHM